MVEYQTLMNLSYLETDIITAEQIEATKIDVSDLTAQNLTITSSITVPTVNTTTLNATNINTTNTNTTNFKMSNGATPNNFLKCIDASGNAIWDTVPAPSNMVTTNTNQTIGGSKTFTNLINSNGITNAGNIYTDELYLENELQFNKSVSAPFDRSILFVPPVNNLRYITFPDVGATMQNVIYDVGIQNITGQKTFNNIITSNFKLTSTPNNNYVLTSDAVGNASWQPPPTAPSNMVTTNTNQTITGQKTFNSTIISNGITNTGIINTQELHLEDEVIFNKGTTGPSVFFVPTVNQERAIIFQDVGHTLCNVLYDVGTQTISGQKSFLSGITASNIRLTTGAVAGRYLTCSNSSGDASWTAFPSNVMLLDAQQTMTRNKIFNTTDTDTYINNSVVGISMPYSSVNREIPYRTIPCPQNMGGYSNFFITRIIGTCDPITSSPTVLTAGIKIYKNRETTPFFTIPTITVTAVGVVPGIGTFDTGNIQTNLNISPADFPLRITIFNNVGGVGTYSITSNTFSFNYFLGSIVDIGGIKVNSLKVDDLGGVMLPQSGTVDQEGDNIIMLQKTDIGNNTIKIKLKDVIKYMYSSLFIPSSFFNFKTNLIPIYSELNNNWWFINTATSGFTPLILEIEGKLKKGTPPIYLGFDPSPPLASNTDPIMSNCFVEDQTIRYKVILKHSSTNVGLSWVARTIPAGTYSDGWDTSNPSTVLSVATSFLAIFVQCYYGGWFNNNYNTRLTNIAVAGNPTLSRTGENRTSILDYFEIFRLRGYY
jgi:hypothetical protein